VQETMTAATFASSGIPADVIRPQSSPIPTPAIDEMLVRVEASPIHPADFMFIQGRYRIRPRFPQTAGLEGCGIVLSVPPGCAVPVGSRVAFRHPGCWAELAAVPVEKAFAMPREIGVDAASQFSLNPITAWALLQESRAAPGEWIALNAASSTVAALVRALARRFGVQVVNIYRGAVPADDKTSVSMDANDLSDALLQATGGQQPVALLDSVGGSGVTRVLPALRVGATILSYGVLGGEPALINNADLIYRNLTWKGFGIDAWLAANKSDIVRMVDAICEAIVKEGLPLPVRDRYGLKNIKAAVEAAATGAGKVLVHPGD
jgi:NADPH:quinone reductase